MSSNIEEYFLDDQVVSSFLEVLETCKRNNLHTEQSHCTIQGFQSPNILMYKSFSYLRNYVQKKDLNLFHIHLIEYFHSGYQKEHDHKQTEDFSFIFYLNDSDGNTVFQDFEIEPKKGKFIFFPSYLKHYAKPSTKNKKIAVGAFRI